MSLTTKQIDELRAYAKDRKGQLAKLINDAADTIEMLSAKLHTSQMERSSQYYHGGWIPVSERLPESRVYVLVTYEYQYGLIDHGISWYEDKRKEWMSTREVTAWMPLPEPYREEGGERCLQAQL